MLFMSESLTLEDGLKREVNPSVSLTEATKPPIMVFCKLAQPFCRGPIPVKNTQKNTIIISVNPKAGRRSPMQRAEKLQALLRKKGFDVALLTDLAEVAAQANTLHAEKRLRVLVGVGGDGTAATLVNLTTPGTPITLLAAGTANLLAKHFRLGSNPKRLAETITHGQALTLDAGLAVSGEGEMRKERLFLVMVGCGFDADIVCGVHAQREKRYQSGHSRGAHISYFSYAKPIFRSLFSYHFPKMVVETWQKDAWTEIEGRARWAFFFNMNRYGWGLPLAPFAKEQDGLLDHVLRRSRMACWTTFSFKDIRFFTVFCTCFSRNVSECTAFFHGHAWDRRRVTESRPMLPRRFLFSLTATRAEHCRWKFRSYQTA